MKKQNKLKLIFTLLILAGLFACFIFACLGTKEINEYENRYAEKLPNPLEDSYLNGDFQDKMESGLSDQIPFAIRMKKEYNNLLSKFTDYSIRFAQSIFKSESAEDEIPEVIDGWEIDSKRLEKYIPSDIPKYECSLNFNPVPNYNDNRYYRLTDAVNIYNGKLVVAPKESGDLKVAETYLSNINQCAILDGIDVYAFYIEREADIDLNTGEKTGNYSIAKGLVPLDDSHISVFEVNSFKFFDICFANTDHHWNHIGSYIAYRELMEMMLPESTPLLPTAETEIGTGSGSRAVGDAQNYSEMLKAYSFDFPSYSYRLDEVQSNSYGNAEGYILNAQSSNFREGLKYGDIYGYDNGEVVIVNNEKPGNGKLLILGDSYDNALLKLIAAHYDCLFAVDLRNYEAKLGKSFDLNSYIEENNISTVLCTIDN